MNKTLQIITGACVVIVLLSAVASVFLLQLPVPKTGQDTEKYITEASASILNPLNTGYLIAGEPVTLIDGVAERPAAPGSAATVTTRYFGNDLSLDLNDDGREDRVFLLTRESGGSGTFFYAVAALDTAGGWIGSQGFFLGDRITPRSIEISADPDHQHVLIISYADRAAGQPLSVQPSVVRSVWIKLDVETMTFGEVEQNFSGEADPDRMTLTMQTWTWLRTIYNNDTELTPDQADRFTLTFANEGIVVATTDCNSMSGRYEVTDNRISFGPMAGTEMFCQNSQEQDFATLFEQARSFFFTAKGELIIELKFDSGSAVFR